ncbi:MAG: DUF547 domain-containing protein [Pseudomonadota bacterium]
MPHLTRRTALAGLLATAVSPVLAAPASRLIEGPWRQFGPSGDPDHGAWAALLARHLKMGSDGVARLSYAQMPKTEVDGYVSSLAAVDPTTLTSNAAFAYWVNLYNALTVQVVLGAYPVRSIRDIGGSLLARGPWRRKVVTVAGRDLSLDDIEHGILRPVWRDPRIHYAVNCASIGCPNLAAEPYVSRRLDAMLTAAAQSYVNHPRGVSVTAEGLVLSSIYDWFISDFGGSDGGVLAHLAAHAAAPLRASIDTSPRIVGHRYDWGLNEA